MILKNFIVIGKELKKDLNVLDGVKLNILIYIL